MLIKYLIVKELQLHKRVLHVFSEAQRVYDFKDVCMQSESSASEALVKLGHLMNASHESCKTLYDCSCSELDDLVDTCRRAGALGSRLTGAGWGGCAVSLLASEKQLQKFLDTLLSEYYARDERLARLFPRAAFSTKPSEGIFIILA